MGLAGHWADAVRATCICTIAQLVSLDRAVSGQQSHAFLACLSRMVPGHEFKSQEEEKSSRNVASPWTMCFFSFLASSPNFPVWGSTVNSLDLLLPKPQKKLSVEKYDMYKGKENSVMNLPCTYHLLVSTVINSHRVCITRSHLKYYVNLRVKAKACISKR